MSAATGPRVQEVATRISEADLQIYLLDNPLPREPLRVEHVKPRLLGHVGTRAGLNLIYAHLNRLSRTILIWEPFVETTACNGSTTIGLGSAGGLRERPEHRRHEPGHSSPEAAEPRHATAARLFPQPGGANRRGGISTRASRGGRRTKRPSHRDRLALRESRGSVPARQRLPRAQAACRPRGRPCIVARSRRATAHADRPHPRPGT
jgi:hypothetical protein